MADDPVPPAPTRPNIVVFYLDDVSPHDGSLWSDPARTPNITNTFVTHGTDFTNAIGEDPLCCPGRAGLLTGLYAHNHGVTYNDARLFDPAMHVGRAMKDAGYASMWIGKYFNKNNLLSLDQWQAHGDGWTDLDAVWGYNGRFLNYGVRTKTGDIAYPDTHSTQMVADRAVQRLRETPAETPVFAVLSIYDLHLPNTPMAQDVGDPRCADMPPWKPPNYNEEDVSDKPPAIRAALPQPYPDGWPMVTYCEEMLGVDRALGEVVDELTADGRLDNTLLVFTADNGIAWGQHRLGAQKVWPYTTPVPLYMSWPARWGSNPRSIADVVSNIDLAPTFCELAQACPLGPYLPGGEGPDGLSLLPLLDGDVTHLERDAVLEESYLPGSRIWSGIRTTDAYDPAARWHYVEYAAGFRELYDLLADPYELSNLASDPAKADLIADLHAHLSGLLRAGIEHGTGTIRLIEDSQPNAAGDFNFSGDLGQFTLDDDAEPTNQNSKTWTDIPSGVYTIVGTIPSGWTPRQIVCQGIAAGDPSVKSLTVFLHPGENVNCTFVDRGSAPASGRPDVSIALSPDGVFKTDNLYSSKPIRRQTRRRSAVMVGATYDYWVRLQNDSTAPDSLNIRATTVGPSVVQVAYLVDGVDVTDQINAGTYETDTLSTGEVRTLQLQMTIEPGMTAGSGFRVLIAAVSSGDPARSDLVRAVALR